MAGPARPPLSLLFHCAHVCHPSPEKVINLPGAEKPQNELNGIKCAPREKAPLADSPGPSADARGLATARRRRDFE